MEKAKKILIFSTSYYPFVGGAEVAVKEITDRISDTRPTESFGQAQFDLITGQFDSSLPKQERLGNVNIYSIGVGIRLLDKLLLPFWGALVALGLNRKNKYDYFWCIMTTFASGAAYIANILKFWKPVPIILTLQEGDSEEHFKNRWFGLINFSWKLALARTSKLTVISSYLGDRAKKFGYKGEINLIPNGVDINKFKIENSKLKIEEREKLRGEMGIKERDVALVTTSRLVLKNGVGDVIKALPNLPENIKFLILGEGDLRASLELLAKSLEVEDRVIFKGYVSHGEMPKYLKACDIFIRTSLSEGMGNSFIEAMASKLPVIATPVGGIPDFLSDPAKPGRSGVEAQTGYFCEPQNPESIVSAVNKVLNDPNKNQIIENAYKMVVAKYDWNLITKRMKLVFNDTVPSKNIKILLTTGIFPPEVGGPATYSALLAKELPKYGINVQVLPFRVVRHFPKIIRHIIFFIKVLVLGIKVDLLYTQDTVSVGFPTMLASKILRKPFLIRVPGDYAWEQSSQRFGVTDSIDEFQKNKYGFSVEILRKVQSATVRNADIAITPSKYFKNLVSGWNPKKNNVIHIYNGIEFANTENQEEFEPKTIISAGRLVPWKGFDVLIEIMQELPDWRLFIAGNGPDKENLDRLVVDLKLTDRVVLLGQIERKDLLKKIHQCQVFILNTSFESFSFQIVEAMHVGTPVISTNIGNISEIVDNGENGFLVEPNNKKEILEAIEKLSDTQLRSKITRKAKEKAKVFSIEKTIQKTTEVIFSLIKNKGL